MSEENQTLGRIEISNDAVIDLVDIIISTTYGALDGSFKENFKALLSTRLNQSIKRGIKVIAEGSSVKIAIDLDLKEGVNPAQAIDSLKDRVAYEVHHYLNVEANTIDVHLRSIKGG